MTPLNAVGSTDLLRAPAEILTDSPHSAGQKLILGRRSSFSRLRSQTPCLPSRRGTTTTNYELTMKLLALLTLAFSLVLVGCEKSEPAAPAAPSTNAVPPAPK
jgi:hypothetical protein